jgi:iron complex outermembrane receptor protein
MTQAFGPGLKSGKAFLLASVALAATPAMAEAESPAASPAASGDIVVTATRTASTVQKVSVAVTAIGADTIAKQQIVNVKDISQIAPNVQIRTVSGGSAGITPFIRGGGVTDGANITSEPEVGIYIDDVYQPRAAASFIELLDIERIEVLRGPQGTLYGRNSSAGALKIVSRMPSDKAGLKLELGTGSWAERQAKVVANAPLSADGKWRAGLSALYRGRDGGIQYNATLGKKVGGEDYFGTKADLAYVGSGLTARLSGFYSNLDGSGLYPVALSPGYAGNGYQTVQPTSGSYRTVLSPSESYTKVVQYGANLNIEADIGENAKLTSISGWSHLRDNWAQDFSGGVPWSALGVPLSGYTSLFDRNASLHNSSFSQELQLHGSLFGDKLTYVGGLYFFRETGAQTVNSKIFFAPSTTVFNIETTSYAAFGQLGWHITPKLTFSAGGRYTQDDKILNATIGGTAVNRKDSWGTFLPKLGLDYQITERVLAYLSFSEGFKAGGYNGLASTATALNSPYDPQKMKAYELGLKTEFLDRKAKLNISAFFNDYASLQQQSVTSTGSFITQNYAADHKGVEAELSVKPVNGLTLWVNGTVNDSKYKASSATLAGVSSYIGNAMTNVFKHQVTAGYDASVPFAGGEVSLGGNVNARSDYYSTPDNLYIGHVPATTLVNAYIGYAKDNWSLRLTGKNLTNEIYWTTGFGFSVVRPRYMGDPRTWRVSFTYKM